MLTPLLQGMTLRHGTIGPCHFEGTYYPHLERSLSPGLRLISPRCFVFKAIYPHRALEQCELQ
jgi:hypothetical protein